MNGKLKVVWICHFSNPEIQNILKPWKRINEMAPWIPALARVLEGQEGIELHIVSPHEYISGYRQFILRGVYYHFYNSHIPFWGRHWPVFFKWDYWTDFACNKYKVKRIINRIKPDLIHLHGAENAYYSSVIFQFRNRYPVLITLQGFLYKIEEDNNNRGFLVKKRIKCELNIYKEFRHFGIRTKTMGAEVQNLKPEAILHWHSYIANIPLIEQSTEMGKKYDLVYFARVSKSKGIEDLLKAISIIKNQKPDIKALIIGHASAEYLDELKDACIAMGIDGNITWAGFLPSQQEVHKAATEARLSVLPVHYDMISGTIIESMLLKIPVVAYNVGSIHEVNEKEVVISLVEKDNIEELAATIMQLLEDNKLLAERAEKGYHRAVKMLEYDRVLADLLNAYHEVIADFK